MSELKPCYPAALGFAEREIQVLRTQLAIVTAERDEAIKLFRLGYAPEAWDDTVNWARSKNYELPSVEQAGLIFLKRVNSLVHNGDSQGCGLGRGNLKIDPGWLTRQILVLVKGGRNLDIVGLIDINHLFVPEYIGSRTFYR